MGVGDKMGKLDRLKKEKNQSFVSTKKFIISSTLFLFGLLTFFLQYFALNQFYNLAIERTTNSISPKIKILFESIEKELLEENLDYINLGLEELVYDDLEALRILALRSLEVSDVQSVYAYNAYGELLDLPTNIEKTKARISPIIIKSAKIKTKFLEDELSIVLPIGEDPEIGFLEVNIDPEQKIIPERKEIKSQVIKQGLMVFIFGSTLLLVIFQIFFKKLDRTEAQLIAKTKDLKNSNKRLIIACKTAGLGAITAHLMHAIKSPLMGLKNIELNQEKHEAEMAGKVLNDTTKQIESMVHETMNCLKEYELDEESYTFEANELLSLTAKKFDTEENRDRVKIISSKWDKIKINNLQANLLLPILQNLVQNALESGQETKVFLNIEKMDDKIVFLVADNGPGIKGEIKDNLFSPSKSLKKHGSGLGLVICKGLAEQINGTIFLKSSSTNGSTFCVEINSLKEL